MRRLLIVGAAVLAIAPAWAAEKRDAAPISRTPDRSLPDARSKPAPDAQMAPGTPAQAEPEVAPTPGPFFVDVGCNGQSLALATQSAQQRERAVAAAHAGGVQKWLLCAKEGWLDYQWSWTELEPAEVQDRLRVEPLGGNRAQLVLEAPLPAYDYADTLAALASGLAIVVGDPAGEGTVTMARASAPSRRRPPGQRHETTFSAGIELTAAGVGFPLGPLEAHILKQVNKGLLESMRAMAMEATLAAGIDALLLRGPEPRIREVAHHGGKLFVDMVED